MHQSRRSILLLSIPLCLAIPALAQDTSAKVAGIDIESRMAHFGVPGVSIAVINNNALEWAKGYGFRDKEGKLPVDTQTVFEAGSISKPVAALGALRLVEQGKLDLDA